MRIRTIKPEFFKHEELFDAELESGLPLRLAFAGLWCAADREGRFKWRPRSLKADVLPFDDCDFSRVLDALVTRGFVVHYACGTREFGAIPSFGVHQVVNHREKPSELPEPPEAAIDAGSDACPTRAPRVMGMPGHARGEGKGKEGKGREHGMDTKQGGSGGDGAPPRVSGKFQKPTMEEWTTYCRTLSTDWPKPDTESAYDHYEANGWFRGKTKVKDWKACARTCFRNWQAQNPNQKQMPELEKDENGELQW